ncbi:procathepsin L-like [Anthonomus grandis grandis]|uniref:procathepsin L-like n=1 Tax=Anthonomus grandis grandis TaxID=2921223 RepID=UPI002165FC97|nr:procathepsin L-like [Anthonomus grandis grandis]
MLNNYTKLLPILACFMGSTIAFLNESEEMWKSFKSMNNKIYFSDVEEKLRFSIFNENLEKIKKNNLDYENGLVTYRLGVTPFADLLLEEYLALLNYKSVNRTSSLKKTTFVNANTNLPESINWLEIGAVTPVLNQEACGSCWSFSATGALEGQYFLKTNQLIPLSQQNLIDCSRDYGNEGCQGGLMDYAFKYVEDYGIMAASDYPYTQQNSICKFDAEKSILKVQSIVDIEFQNETQLAAAVGTIGPISVSVDASYWQLYSGGIFNDVYCGTEIYSLNHGVLAVGYETDPTNGIEYWLVKNSWGDTWGENGYIRLAKNGRNQCGIATEASYPVV